MGRRALLVIAAMLVAAFGTGMIWLYVNGLQDQARNHAATVKVLVAKENLTKGSKSEGISIAAGNIESIDVAKDVAGESYITGDNLSAFKGQVLLERVAKGLPLQRSMFGDQAGLASDAFQKDKLAISITLTDPARVAGMLQPRSKVTIFRTQEDATTGRYTDVLLYDALVLSANGVTPADGSTGANSAPKAQVTFELSTTNAGKVVFAASNPKIQLWLGLQNSDKQPRLTGPITDGTLPKEAP
jgi:pilus assembly protein CpaB